MFASLLFSARRSRRERLCHLGPSAPHELEIAAVQLPGRETRLDEEPLRTLASAAELIAEAIASNDKRPFALFGHSLGGKLTIRVALLLEKTQMKDGVMIKDGHFPSSIYIERTDA